ALTIAATNDFGWKHFQAAPQKAWPGLRAERNGGLVGEIGRMRDPRQVVGHTLYRQMMQINTDDFRGETSVSGDRQRGCRSADRCCIVVGIGESADGAGQHDAMLP